MERRIALKVQPSVPKKRGKIASLPARGKPRMRQAFPTLLIPVQQKRHGNRSWLGCLRIRAEATIPLGHVDRDMKECHHG
jgi:hypothetical protein